MIFCEHWYSVPSFNVSCPSLFHWHSSHRLPLDTSHQLSYLVTGAQRPASNLFNSVCKVWNFLPGDLRNLHTFNQFQKQIIIYSYYMLYSVSMAFVMMRSINSRLTLPASSDVTAKVHRVRKKCHFIFDYNSRISWWIFYNFLYYWKQERILYNHV